MRKLVITLNAMLPPYGLEASLTPNTVVLPDLGPRGIIWLMNKLLEQAIAELAALPEDQQKVVAARILEEVERQTGSKGKWAKVADHLARLDLLQGKS